MQLLFSIFWVTELRITSKKKKTHFIFKFKVKLPLFFVPPGSVSLKEKLVVKLETYKFHQLSVRFLGYILEELGLHIWIKQTWKQSPPDQSTKELQRFVRLADFCCWFIWGFQICSSLSRKCRGGASADFYLH